MVGLTIKIAKEKGLYVILDMHGAPGDKAVWITQEELVIISYGLIKDFKIKLLGFGNRYPIDIKTNLRCSL